MCIRFIRPERGMSTVQALVLAAALAAAGLIMTNLMREQKLAQKGAESKDNVERLHQLIYSTIQDRDHCYGTMLAAYPSGILPAESHTREISSIIATNTITASQSTIVAVNPGTAPGGEVYMDNSVTVSGITLEVKPVSAGDPAADYQQPAILNVRYRKLDGGNANTRTKQGYGGKDIQKQVPVIIQQDPFSATPNRFIGCYGLDPSRDQTQTTDLGNQTLNKNFCESLSTSTSGDSIFTYDDLTNTCVLKRFTCEPGEIFTGIRADGTRICNKLHDWVDMSKLIDLNSTSFCKNSPKVRFDKDGNNKVKVICDPCIPTTPCSTLAESVCSGVAVGMDSCENDCGTGTKYCCTVTASCSTIAAGVCSTQSAGSDNCGNSCGMGTKVCTCSPTTSCSSIAAGVCSSQSAGNDSCGTSCGMGTMSCSCTPTTPCSTIAAGVCSDQSAGSDSCGNSCGMGTKSCSCSPATPCSTLVSSTCSQDSAGSDSCGNSCGMGSLDCSTCTPTTACADIAATVCSGDPTGSDSCGNSCGPGTKNCTCNPTTDCGTLAAATCSGQSAGTDSCGTGCGMGTMSCGCTPTAPCSTIAATVCSGTNAGTDSCGNTCGSGTMFCTCTPTTPCSTIAADICSGLGAGSDSCGNSCGMGTKNCATCTPTTPCATEAAKVCLGQVAEDSCGKECSGTKDCSVCTPTIPCSTLLATQCSTKKDIRNSCGTLCGDGAIPSPNGYWGEPKVAEWGLCGVDGPLCQMTRTDCVYPNPSCPGTACGTPNYIVTRRDESCMPVGSSCFTGPVVIGSCNECCQGPQNICNNSGGYGTCGAYTYCAPSN